MESHAASCSQRRPTGPPGRHLFGFGSRHTVYFNSRREAQCAELAAKFPFHSRISQVFSSPLQRTVATAYLGFYPALKNRHCKPEILALPDAQETSDYPLDTGSDLADLQRLCKQKGWSVDLSLVHDGWNDKSWDGRWAPTARRIKARARDARRTIREMVEEMQKAGVQSPEVVLVSHGGFLHYFTEEWEDSDVYSGTAWANTEFRSYTFDEDDEANEGIRETPESRKRRGKKGRQPTRARADEEG